MTWLEIFGWFIAFSLVTNFCFRRGVKVGIKHALTTLHLDHHQTELLNIIYNAIAPLFVGE